MQEYMSVKPVKDIDQRHVTKGGGVIRVETWIDEKTETVTSYNLAYINTSICTVDNGRVLGFDNAHLYPGFPTLHHEHHFGEVIHNDTYQGFDDLLDRFQAELGVFKKVYGKRY